MRKNQAMDAVRYIDEYASPRQLRRLEKKAQRQLNGDKQIADEIYNKSRRTNFNLCPKTQSQAELIEGMATKTQVVAFGPAGTGKTFVIAAYAAKLYLSGAIKKIIITRPNVSTGISLGLFPGSLEEKMMVWVGPVVSVLKEVMGTEIFEAALRKENIVLQPIETIRGCSFDGAFVIVDEAQNINVDEIKAIVTRIGENTTLVLNGDIAQKDIKGDCGLAFVVDSIERNETLSEMSYIVEFDSDDIVRSALVKAWIKEFERHDNLL